MTQNRSSFFSGARSSLGLLLILNLLCYLDRYILAAVIPSLKAEFLANDPDANAKAGLLTTAFIVSYMLCAPVFGWLADRYSRWTIIAISVAVWSLASGASGLAGGFVALLITRIFLGIGEAGYGPAAPTIISDHYPVEKRGQVLAWFFMAIPVGSALGYAFGGLVDAHLGWRWAFYLVVPPGILLAILAAFMRDPRTLKASGGASHKSATFSDYKKLLKIPSLTSNILAQTAMTFAIGGLSVWAPTYIHEARGIPLDRANLMFGGILVVGGLISTLLGGWLGDRLQSRFPGAYFLVSGTGMALGFPCVIAMLYTPFPYAWIFVFFAMFFLFLNIGPSNTAIANVTPSGMRSTAFALNILIIHLLGDAISPPLIGWIKDRSSWEVSFFAVSCVMLISSVIWLSTMRSLVVDTEAVTAAEAEEKAKSAETPALEK
jgi:MFS family permease